MLELSAHLTFEKGDNVKKKFYFDSQKRNESETQGYDKRSQKKQVMQVQFKILFNIHNINLKKNSNFFFILI